jgi:hypothetical protein
MVDSDVIDADRDRKVSRERVLARAKLSEDLLFLGCNGGTIRLSCENSGLTRFLTATTEEEAEWPPYVTTLTLLSSVCGRVLICKEASAEEGSPSSSILEWIDEGGRLFRSATFMGELNPYVLTFVLSEKVDLVCSDNED